MQQNKPISRDVLVIAAGQLLCIGVMVGVYALLGYFSLRVIWGGLMGGALATANFLVLSLTAEKATQKAQAQDVAGGQKLITLSYTLRMALLFGALILCALSGVFDLIALALPLAFNRPILTVAEHFRKKEDPEV